MLPRNELHSIIYSNVLLLESNILGVNRCDSSVSGLSFCCVVGIGKDVLLRGLSVAVHVSPFKVSVGTISMSVFVTLCRQACGLICPLLISALNHSHPRLRFFLILYFSVAITSVITLMLEILHTYKSVVPKYFSS